MKKQLPSADIFLSKLLEFRRFKENINFMLLTESEQFKHISALLLYFLKVLIKFFYPCVNSKKSDIYIISYVSILVLKDFFQF